MHTTSTITLTILSNKTNLFSVNLQIKNDYAYLSQQSRTIVCCHGGHSAINQAITKHIYDQWNYVERCYEKHGKILEIHNR